MPPKASSKFVPPTSDEAVQAKTGKIWSEWFAILDAAGAASLSHKEIVAVLHDQHGVGPWWQQSITVAYEQARGLRARHQTTSGFEASASKTINVPLETLAAAWKVARARRRWLEAPSLTARDNKSAKNARFDWADPPSRVNVYLTSKSDSKSHVAVQHTMLPNASAVKKQKAFWTEALGVLKEKLEGE